jgi:PAS domain-containing protein
MEGEKSKTRTELTGDLREMRRINAQLNALEAEHKQTEHRLIASEMRYRRLFETAQDGILIINAESGEITDVNPFLSEMQGYTKEYLIGQELWK